MDLSLNDEQQAFRDLARDFLDREAVPHRTRWDREEQVDLAIIPKLAEIGFFGLTIPEEYGGLGGDYVLNGQKLFITNGTWADVALVFARTSDDGPRGVSAFLVPTDTPGFEAREIKGKLGLRGQATAELFLSDVRLPASALLGEEGRGFKIAMTTLDKGRVSVGTRNAVTPRAPSSLVRANTSATSAQVPLVMNSFWPFRM